ncbi:hypothetical protein SALBM311S_06937 [Streptomyces alboniger]
MPLLRATAAASPVASVSGRPTRTNTAVLRSA